MVPTPTIAESAAYAPTPRSKWSLTSLGSSTCCGASWSIRMTAKRVIVTQSHGIRAT